MKQEVKSTIAARTAGGCKLCAKVLVERLGCPRGLGPHIPHSHCLWSREDPALEQPRGSFLQTSYLSARGHPGPLYLCQARIPASFLAE